MKRFLLSLAAGGMIFGVAALIPAPASAQMSGVAAAINLGAENTSNLIEVGRRHRHRHRHRGHRHRHQHHHHHWRRGFFFAPHAYHPRRCGYVWSWRHDRRVWRCW